MAFFNFSGSDVFSAFEDGNPFPASSFSASVLPAKASSVLGSRLLDLGISTESGEINEGLFNFKKSLGCSTSEKNTYRLSYD